MSTATHRDLSLVDLPVELLECVLAHVPARLLVGVNRRLTDIALRIQWRHLDLQQEWQVEALQQVCQRIATCSALTSTTSVTPQLACTRTLSLRLRHLFTVHARARLLQTLHALPPPPTIGGNLQKLCLVAEQQYASMAFTDDFFQQLARAPCFPHLRALELRHCTALTDVGMHALLLWNPGWQELVLFGCDLVTDRTLALLWKRQVRMQRLWVQQCRLVTFRSLLEQLQQSPARLSLQRLCFGPWKPGSVEELDRLAEIPQHTCPRIRRICRWAETRQGWISLVDMSS